MLYSVIYNIAMLINPTMTTSMPC